MFHNSTTRIYLKLQNPFEMFLSAVSSLTKITERSQGALKKKLNQPLSFFNFQFKPFGESDSDENLIEILSPPHRRNGRFLNIEDVMILQRPRKLHWLKSVTYLNSPAAGTDEDARKDVNWKEKDSFKVFSYRRGGRSVSFSVQGDHGTELQREFTAYRSRRQGRGESETASRRMQTAPACMDQFSADSKPAKLGDACIRDSLTLIRKGVPQENQPEGHKGETRVRRLVSEMMRCTHKPRKGQMSVIEVAPWARRHDLMQKFNLERRNKEMVQRPCHTATGDSIKVNRRKADRKDVAAAIRKLEKRYAITAI